MAKYLLNSLLIPHDFESQLPTLKEQTFQWKADLRLSEDSAPRGSITHYSIGPAPRGNIVLAPGLASNTNIEPLMKAITYWSLSHKYNIYCVNSFLGDFQAKPTLAMARRNTFPEFVDVMDMSLDIIEKHCIGTWTCIIGHSAGGSAAIEIFNRRIINGLKPRVSAAILFAPLIHESHTQCLKMLYRRFYHLQDIPENEFQKMPMNMASPSDIPVSEKIRYVPIMPKFLDDIGSRPLRLDLMNQWGIPITIVGGGLDRKVPIEQLRAAYEQISAIPNGNLFKFVEFKTSKHSFIDQHKNWDAVINLIKSQRIRHSRTK